jgi:hypothetical protein
VALPPSFSPPSAKMSAELRPPPRRLQPGNVPLSQLRLPQPPPNGEALDEFLRQAECQPHTWTHCAGRAFRVRRGPRYDKNHTKAPSDAALYDVFAVDVFSSEAKLPHIGRVAELPDDTTALPGGCGLPPYVIINWMVPNYPPGGILGHNKHSDGPGWNLVLYCRVSDALRATLAGDSGAEAPRPSVELLRRFMHPSEGARLRGERLKCIMGLADLEKPGFGMVLKQLIARCVLLLLSRPTCSSLLPPSSRLLPLLCLPPQCALALCASLSLTRLCSPPLHAPCGRYNFKPFLSKTASFCYLGRNYFEIDIDIHTVKGKLPKMLLRGAVLVEADTDEEMPEQIIASLCMTQIDPSRAPQLEESLTAYLNEPANYVPPLLRVSKAGGTIAESASAFSREASPPRRDGSPPPTDPPESLQPHALLRGEKDVVCEQQVSPS